jgi:hypothetical protein
MILMLLALSAKQPALPPIRVEPLPHTAYPSDDEFCAAAKKISADMTSKLPKMIDAITRLDEVSTVCSLRTFTMNKFVDADVNAFRKGWRERKQRQLNEVVCHADFIPLVRRGWRFTQTLTFRSGERVIMNASC